MIRLIIGLGNPGNRYIKTRHNAGFWLLDTLADKNGGRWQNEGKFQAEIAQITLGEQSVFLCKPQTFMNASGRAVAALCRFYNLSAEHILIVHDELDLPAGVLRLKFGGGHGGHNGLRDIIAALGSRDFYRLRIGIDRPPHGTEVIDYVLGVPSKSSIALIDDALILGEMAITRFIQEGAEKAMHWLHSHKTGDHYGI